MAPQITPPPDRTSTGEWPGESQKIRDAYDAKLSTK